MDSMTVLRINLQNAGFKGGKLMKTDQELKRDYLILFSILFVAGIIVILRSYSINLSTLIEFDQNRVAFGCISWIVAGSILSLLSGYAIANLLLKDIMK
jgi:uncharacterized membrane protein YjjP (DUF1212 family)